MEGSRLQINFERLLKKCENIASQNPDLFTAYLTQSDPFSGNVGSALDNFFEPVSNPEADYRKYVKTLRSYLKKLEQQANDSSPAKPKAMLSTEKLSEYQQRVAVLKDILYPEQVAIKKETSNATKMRVQRDVHRVFRNQLLGESSNVTIESKKLDEVVDMERKKQEEISQELVLLTQGLKANAEHSLKLLRQDHQQLDSLDTVVSANVSKTERENTKLQQEVDKGTTFTLTLWMLITIVCLVFVFMVLFMKVFSPKRRIPTE